MGNWKTISQDPDLKFLDRSAVDLKDRHIVFISSNSALPFPLLHTFDRVVDRLSYLLVVASCHFNRIAVRSWSSTAGIALVFISEMSSQSRRLLALCYGIQDLSFTSSLAFCARNRVELEAGSPT